eukprot:COSAG06_NODE_4757_length_3979_cov_1.884794_3_plen_51_part_00
MWAREGTVRLLGPANSHSACSRTRLTVRQRIAENIRKKWSVPTSMRHGDA